MLTENVLIDPVLPLATGSASRNSSSVDCRGYLGVVFALQFGGVSAGAAHTAKLQASNDGATWSDVAGWSFAIAPAVADGLALVDVHRPKHRYLRLALEKDGANDSSEAATVARYKAQREPVAHADPLQVSLSRLATPETV